MNKKHCTLVALLLPVVVWLLFSFVSLETNIFRWGSGERLTWLSLTLWLECCWFGYVVSIGCWKTPTPVRPGKITLWKLTKENQTEVAKWCQGKITQYGLCFSGITATWGYWVGQNSDGSFFIATEEFVSSLGITNE